jgi:UDP-glucose 4-epimerase
MPTFSDGSVAPLKLAVFGATGFVGRRLVEQLVQGGAHVTAVVRDPATARLPESVQRVAWDARSEHPPSHDSLKDCDVICNLMAHIPSSYADATEARACMDVNALGSLAVIACAERSGAHLVHLSTTGIYSPADHPVVETACTYPAAHATFYLASKLAGELYVSNADRRGVIAATILRVASVYGRGMRAGGLVELLTTRLLKGEQVTLAGGGNTLVDLVHVDDVVRATIAAAVRRPRAVLNIGSGDPIRVQAVLEVLRGLIGNSTSPIELKEGSGQQQIAMADVRAAVETLGFEPRSFAVGVRDLLEDYRRSQAQELSRA